MATPEGDTVSTEASAGEQGSSLREAMSQVREHLARVRAASGTPTEGRQLGDFRLLREIGRGGMGTVWEAEQVSLGRRVALKLLASHYTLRADALHRFHREAEAGGRLDHPGIVAVYAVGEDEGTHFIAQQLVGDGFSLADFLAEMRQASELPKDYYREIGELFARMADALQIAHDAAVIHRDIKPGNLLIDEHDQPKVADFGLAKITDELALSHTGDFAGTPYYMSPEQAMSKRMGIDLRTDIFSLGATLYEALTLARPFEGDTSQQVLSKIMLDEPADPRRLRSRVPWDLAVICQKAMQKKPEHRYPSMAELAADLRRHLDNEPILARPPGAITRALKWTRRHPVVSTSGVVAAAATIVICWLFIRYYDMAERTQVALFRAQMAESAAIEERDAKEAALVTAGAQRQRAVELAIEAEQEAERAKLLLAESTRERDAKEDASLRATVAEAYYRSLEARAEQAEARLVEFELAPLATLIDRFLNAQAAALWKLIERAKAAWASLERPVWDTMQRVRARTAADRMDEGLASRSGVEGIPAAEVGDETEEAAAGDSDSPD